MKSTAIEPGRPRHGRSATRGLRLFACLAVVLALFAAGWQIGPKTFLILNAGFCQGRPVSISNTFGASMQYRFDRSWRAEASFEPLRTCAAPAVEAQTQSVVRQLGLDLLWEKRF